MENHGISRFYPCNVVGNFFTISRTQFFLNLGPVLSRIPASLLRENYAMSNNGVNTGRRRFLTAATSVVGAAGVVGVAVPFVGSWNPSAKAKAAGAPVKQDISKIEPGQMITVEWRGMPVYVVRRTAEALESIKKMDSLVRDPASNESNQPAYAKSEYRSIKDEYLVLMAVCTHLGCAPQYKPEVGSVSHEWLGGFLLPVPRLQIRSGRSRSARRARADQPRSPALPLLSVTP